MTAHARIRSLDLLRGIVIALMALDHTRDFFQPAGVSPTHWETTSLAFFAMRWVTHFCAPVFVFLAGVSVALYVGRRADAGESRWGAWRFLVTRGLWLMLLEPTWVSFSWYFHFDWSHLGVLWAIGGSMVLLGAVLWLPRRAIGILGLVLTFVLHAWPVPEQLPVLGFLCQPQGVDLLGHRFHQSYAIVPWFAVLACGYGFADWITDRLAAAARHRELIGAGAVGFALFATLRGANGFGDPAPWEVQARGWWVTACDLMNPSKYPPSLHYQLMTLGPAIAALPLLARWQGRIGEAVRVFGQVPMFFYLIHLPLAHLLGLIHARVRFGADHIPAEQPLSLALILGAWLLVLALTWPPCRWWRGLKQRHRDWRWLSYL